MRSMFRLFLYSLTLGALLGQPALAQLAEKREISPLTVEDRSQLDRQRRIIANLMRDNFGAIQFRDNKSELRYIQHAIDNKLIPSTDLFDLQALGVVLGDIMVNNLPHLSWVIVEDRYGRSKALRYGGTDNLFFPITMISRRVANGIEVDVEQLYNKVEEEVKALQRRGYR